MRAARAARRGPRGHGCACSARCGATGSRRISPVEPLLDGAALPRDDVAVAQGARPTARPALRRPQRARRQARQDGDFKLYGRAATCGTRTSARRTAWRSRPDRLATSGRPVPPVQARRRRGGLVPRSSTRSRRSRPGGREHRDARPPLTDALGREPLLIELGRHAPRVVPEDEAEQVVDAVRRDDRQAVRRRRGAGRCSSRVPAKRVHDVGAAA